jgi:hypothetical protein
VKTHHPHRMHINQGQFPPHSATTLRALPQPAAGRGRHPRLCSDAFVHQHKLCTDHTLARTDHALAVAMDVPPAVRKKKRTLSLIANIMEDLGLSDWQKLACVLFFMWGLIAVKVYKKNRIMKKMASEVPRSSAPTPRAARKNKAA